MNFINKYLDRLKIFLPAILLGASVVYNIINCYYYEKVWQFTWLFILLEIVFFFLFDQLKKRKILGGIIYTGLLAIAISFSYIMLSNGYSSTGVIFSKWFYFDRQTAGFVMEYFIALFFGGGFFIISIMYYFTQIIYRSIGSMLCVLFPFVIYAKRSEKMSEFAMAVMITLYLAVLVHSRINNSKNSETKVIINIPYLLSVALFVSMVSAVVMVIPKPEVKSLLEYDSNAFNPDFDDSGSGSSDYQDLNPVSSPRSGGSFTNKELFRFSSTYDDDVYYLKSQHFGTFKGNQWVDSELADDDYFEFDNIFLNSLNRKELYETFKALAKTGKYEKYGLTEDLFVVSSPTQYKFSEYSKTFIPSYLPAVSEIDVSEPMNNMRYYPLNGMFNLYNGTEAVFSYNVDYYPETKQYQDFVLKLKITNENYLNILKDAYENGDLKDTQLYDEYKLIQKYYISGIEYTKELKQLSENVTKNCKTNYEKATAICNYFSTNDFKYDMEYVPENDSIEYFLFESKTGSCTSYATAMTLMARLSGVPARYCEGFVAFDMEDDGSYIVRDVNAHAFVEVFVPGAGWITFDPTVAGYMDVQKNYKHFDYSVFFQYLSKILIFLAVLFVLFFILFLDRIIEFFFRIRLKFAKGDKRIILLYRHIIKLLEFSSKDDLSSYTVNMVIDYTLHNRSKSIKKTALLFEKTCFGGINLEDSDYKNAYLEYKCAYKNLRKIPKSYKKIK